MITEKKPQRETMNEYFAKAVAKFDANHIDEYESTNANKVFLKPIGLGMSGGIPDNYGDNTAAFADDEEGKFFRAYHFIKYKAHEQLEWDHATEKVVNLFLAIRNRILSANMGLIYTCIRRFKPRARLGLSNDHLISEGQKALMKAVDGFNPYKGFKFSTYACWSILREFSRLNKQAKEIAADPTLDDMTSLANEDYNHHDEERDLWMERLQHVIRTNAAGLDAVEIKIIDARYQGKTFGQMADEMDTSKQHVQVIHKRALEKIRTTLFSDPILA